MLWLHKHTGIYKTYFARLKYLLSKIYSISVEFILTIYLFGDLVMSETYTAEHENYYS